MIQAGKRGNQKFDGVVIVSKYPPQGDDSPMQVHRLAVKELVCESPDPEHQITFRTHDGGQNANPHVDLKHRGNFGGSDQSTEPAQALAAKSSQLSQLKSDFKRLQNQLELEQSEHRRTKKLLTESYAQIQAANTFLNQNDAFSIAEIIQLMQEVNYSIQQLTAQITEVFGSFDMPARQQTARLDWEVGRAQDHLSKDIGICMSKVVEHPVIQGNIGTRVNWIQILLRTALVQLAYDFLRTHCWSENPDLDKALREVYTLLLQKNSVSRAIAGKWRTVTRMASRTVRPMEPLVSDGLTRMREVLLAFGGRNVVSEADFAHEFRDDLEHFATRLIELDVAIRERISTVDIFPMIIRAGRRFDPRAMIDTNSVAEDCSDAHVFSSVTLGLVKKNDLEPEEQPSILLKPQVVLERLLYSMDCSVDELNI